MKPITTNTEMSAYVAERNRKKRKVIERVGCCGRLVGRDCMYLGAICPFQQMATEILRETRGLR